MKGEDLRLITSYNVTSADTDMHSRLRPGSLVNFLIQSAISSAESLGFGFNDLKNENLFWVLNRLSVEIYRPVKWNEVINVETWPKDLERIFYLRDFIVRDSKDNIVAKASSAWLAIDVTSKRPGNFSKEKIKAFTLLNDFHALNYSPYKLGGVKEHKSRIIIPGYFDIDLNKHVTSTRYIDWMIDNFTPECHQKNYPSHLSVNYIKETMYGEGIKLLHENNNPEHNFEGFNISQDKTAFRGKIIF